MRDHFDALIVGLTHRASLRWLSVAVGYFLGAVIFALTWSTLLALGLAVVGCLALFKSSHAFAVERRT